MFEVDLSCLSHEPLSQVSTKDKSDDAITKLSSDTLEQDMSIESSEKEIESESEYEEP